MGNLPGQSLTDQVFGSYHVRERVGKGGMGEVYRAHDRALDRMVAMKFLLRSLASDEDFVRRFRREARAAARLNHPNIVQIHAVDVEARPPYMVQEFVEGVSLEQMIRKSQPIPWQQALTICGQVASALSCSHDQGIIHRDIKPGNILIERSGRARVTDFGIAKVMGNNTNITKQQTTIGSPTYMSPEQCGVGKVVPASDLFSLGITTFEMITGSPPYEADTTVAMIKKITSDPTPSIRSIVPEIPATVEQFINALLSKSLDQRYASAVQVVEDLQCMMNNQPMKHLRSLNLDTMVANENLPAVASSLPALQPHNEEENALNVKHAGNALVQDLLDTGKSSFERTRSHIPPDREFPWSIVLTVGAIVLGIVGGLGVLGFLVEQSGDDTQEGARSVIQEASPMPAQPQPGMQGPPPQGYPPPHYPPPGQPGAGGQGQFQPGQHPPPPRPGGGQFQPGQHPPPHPPGQGPGRNGQRPPPPRQQ